MKIVMLCVRRFINRNIAMHKCFHCNRKLMHFTVYKTFIESALTFSVIRTLLSELQGQKPSQLHCKSSKYCNGHPADLCDFPDISNQQLPCMVRSILDVRNHLLHIKFECFLKAIKENKSKIRLKVE